MKTLGFALATLLISFAAQADSGQDFAKLNSSLDTGVEQTPSAKNAASNQRAQQEANQADPNLIAPIRKQDRSPARDASATLGQ